MNKYDEIIDGLLRMEITSVNGPNFKSSQYEKSLKETKLKALKKARINAEEMAAALGQKIGSAKLISSIEGRPNSNTGYSDLSAGDTNQQSGSSFQVGKISRYASVKVSFRLLG